MSRLKDEQQKFQAKVQDVTQRVEDAVRGLVPDDTLGKQLHDVADRLMEPFFKDRKIDCSIRCSYCCVCPVETTQPEIDRLARHLLDNCTPEEISAFIVAIDECEDQRKTKKTLCPLLRNNRCSVYEFRPMACRAFNSYYLKACKKGEFPTERVLQKRLDGYNPFPIFVWGTLNRAMATPEFGNLHSNISFLPGLKKALN